MSTNRYADQLVAHPVGTSSTLMNIACLLGWSLPFSAGKEEKHEELHCLIENSLAQEREGGSPVALAFNEFKPTNMTFDNTITVG
ncbi:hypothetical protein KSZ_65360 [Dictyobacter formicarum]|uniref:Uncharacterized protein n=1 Tax=Dictyobacter formicarum TaxID=2778368 RepID=A0ABQ3VRT4_9CHLR|nr:hypothetical protein KSZ_65360 [Dictyobacter formicarum]